MKRSAGYSVRPTAVAGSFYPAEPAELEEAVRRYLAAGQGSLPEGTPAAKAIIAPHAGYLYSGPIAGSAFAALAPAASVIHKVILLGPAHRIPVRGLALPESIGFSTPLGVVPIDGDGARAVSRLPQVRVQPEAHLPEHSLEVELPFLQVLLGSFKIVPLLVGDAAIEEIAEVIDRVWGETETAIVISSDLSHYLPYEAARRTDEETAEEILRLAGPIDPRRACGAWPINGLLLAARRRRLNARLLDLRSSGDTAGDRERVVGYGAFAFYE